MYNLCGVRKIDGISNVEIKRGDMNVGVGDRMVQGVLRWFGYVERMGEEKLARKMYDSNVRAVRGGGRSRKYWMDGVRKVLARKGLGI